MAALSGLDPAGRNWFGRIVLREFRSEVDGEDGDPWWDGGREVFYGTDVIIGCLKIEGGKRS